MGGSNRRHEQRERVHAQLQGGRGLRIEAHSLSITLPPPLFSSVSSSSVSTQARLPWQQQMLWDRPSFSLLGSS